MFSEGNFAPGSENYFAEIKRLKPDEKGQRRLMDWGLEYQAIKALQSPDKGDVLKATEELIRGIYKAGIDSFRSPFSIQAVYAATPLENHRVLMDPGSNGDVPVIVEITRKVRSELAAETGEIFNPDKPSQKDRDLIIAADRK